MIYQDVSGTAEVWSMYVKFCMRILWSLCLEKAMHLWPPVTHLRCSILTNFTLLADFLMVEMSVLYMNMLNMNVYRHRYWNLFSLLPLFVTHHHTAFLIVPDAPCKLSVLKVLRCSSSRPRKDWVVTEQSFADGRHLPFLRNLLLLLEEDFSILHFFFAKVLQHIHLCMFKSA